MLLRLSTLHGLIGALVVALPAPAPAPIVAGDIILAKPKHFDNPMPHLAKIGYHPAIALTDPDEHGNIKIAPISHSHPGNPPTKPLSDYNIHLTPGKDHETSGEINVATPATVHVSNAKISLPHTKVEPHQLEALKGEIRKNCGNHVVRRSDGPPDPCDRETTARAAHEAFQQKSHPPPSHPVAGPSSHRDTQPTRPKGGKKKRARRNAAANHPSGPHNGGSNHNAQAGPSGAQHSTSHGSHARSSGSQHSNSHHAQAGSSNAHPTSHNAHGGHSATSHHTNSHNAQAGSSSSSTHHSNAHTEFWRSPPFE